MCKCNYIEKARNLAIQAHTGQVDKAGKDYYTAHVAVVAEGVKDDPTAMTVAYLHDIAEDTSVTIDDIRTEFPAEVADAVAVLTHKKGVPYAYYIWQVQQNPITTKVKLSDLRSNMDLNRLPGAPSDKDIRRTLKYSRSYEILSNPLMQTGINPYAFRTFLIDAGWEIVKENSNFVEFGGPSQDCGAIRIPLNLMDYDYFSRMNEAIMLVSWQLDSPLDALLEKINKMKPKR